VIFKAELAEKILRGEKTQTRRIVKPGEQHILSNNHAILAVFDAKGRLKWKLGALYAICPGRTKPGIGFIRITQIKRQHLRNMWDADVKAEGVPEGRTYTNNEPFGKLWNTINKKPGIRWEDNPEVWAITFELAED
jgi:hypothetical protein